MAEAQYQLGAALRRSSGYAEEAESALQEAVRLDPDHARAHYELGTCCAAAAAMSPARHVALRRATVLAPGLVAAQRELAALAKRQQDWPSVPPR